MTTTLTYDAYFVGAVKYIQVGPVRYAYHRFGPFTKAGARVSDERGAWGGSTVAAAAAAAAQRRERAPLVFISGLGTSMYMWPIPLLNVLADTREVVIFDTMRSGLSTDISSAPLTIPTMARSVADLFARLRLRTPDLWAWSLGGCIAYELLATHSTKIGSVVVASGSPGGPASFVPPPGVWEELGAAGNRLDKLLPLLFPGGVEDEGVCSWFAAFNSFSSTDLTSLKAPIDTKALKEQLAAMTLWASYPGAGRGLASATNRVLVLHGVQDRIVPVRNARQADDALLGAWVLQFPGAGHALPFSQQRAMVSMTEEFLGFAEPLSPSMLRAWADYGQPARARARGSMDAIPAPATAPSTRPQQQGADSDSDSIDADTDSDSNDGAAAAAAAAAGLSLPPGAVVPPAGVAAAAATPAGPWQLPARPGRGPRRGSGPTAGAGLNGPMAAAGPGPMVMGPLGPGLGPPMAAAGPNGLGPGAGRGRDDARNDADDSPQDGRDR